MSTDNGSDFRSSCVRGIAALVKNGQFLLPAEGETL